MVVLRIINVIVVVTAKTNLLHVAAATTAADITVSRCQPSTPQWPPQHQSE